MKRKLDYICGLYIGLSTSLCLALAICHPKEKTLDSQTIIHEHRFEINITIKHEQVNTEEILELVEETIEETVEEPIDIFEIGDTVLNSWIGVVYHYDGTKETYYNLPMSGVVGIMRRLGYSEEEYPYWVREDGVKMLGPYVMVAAPLDIYPRGSIVETTLGTGLVCDTGDMVGRWLDIAVDW